MFMVPVFPGALRLTGISEGKPLINSFILANLCDALITGVALTLPGFVEKGILGEGMLAGSQVFELLILKTAITAFMIGIYALTAHRQGRWSAPIQTALRLGTMAVWAVVAWNEVNVLLALVHPI
jgi:hypothetical protein